MEHVKKEAERYGLTFHTYKESVTDAYREQMDVSKDLRAGGGIIYLYPFLLDQLPANPFLAEKRTFPVEFPAKFTRRFFGFYRLPEGYEPESLPKPMRMHTHDRMASVSCLLDRRPDGLQVMLELKVNQSIIPARYYGELRELWDVFIESAQTLLTLKRTGGKDGAPVSVSDTAARGDS